MKNTIITLFILFLGFGLTQAQDIYSSTKGSISFFSETPMENIDATNHKLRALLNVKSGEVAFIVTNNGFEFEKPLMEEHFNENYIESHKYKLSVFKGKVDFGTVDLSKDGTYEVNASGSLDIHGVKKDREIKGTIEVKNGELILTTNFDVLLKDHDIKIPKIVTEKIAESVLVKVNITFSPKQKTK